MLRQKHVLTAALPAWGLLVLLALACCAGCSSKDDGVAPASSQAGPAAGGTASLPPQAQAAEQAQQKADAASHAAHAPH